MTPDKRAVGLVQLKSGAQYLVDAIDRRDQYVEVRGRRRNVHAGGTTLYEEATYAWPWSEIRAITEWGGAS